MEKLPHLNDIDFPARLAFDLALISVEDLYEVEDEERGRVVGVLPLGLQKLYTLHKQTLVERDTAATKAAHLPKLAEREQYAQQAEELTAYARVLDDLFSWEVRRLVPPEITARAIGVGKGYNLVIKGTSE